jgi:hypothetical protein
MRTQRVRVGLAALMLLVAGGCVTKETCRPGTVLLRLTMEGAAKDATTVTLTTSVAGAPPKTSSADHLAGDATFLVQINLTPYQGNADFALGAVAIAGGRTFEAHTTDARLAPGCTVLALTLGERSDGGGSEAGADSPHADAPTDVVCGSGGHLCSSSHCAANDDPATCGARCTPCPMPANAASATCDGTTCGFTCKAGFHPCGNACADDKSPASCGTSCTPCVAPTDGEATCEGTTCGGKCGAGKKLCAGRCIDEGTDCNFICSMGTHDCNGLCAANDNINTCGPSACTACQTPANGTVSCDGTACKATCQDGYKACPDATCVPRGGCCTSAECTPPANSLATCTAAHVCMLSCTNGYHLCNGQCVANDQPAHCGTSCTPCPKPAGAVAATCDGQACGATCPTGEFLCAGACIPTSQQCMNECAPGTHECGGQCLADASINSCGASCTPCPMPANGQATCELVGTARACGFTCATGYKKCGTQCIPNASCCVKEDCPAVANGAATCSANHLCGFTCGGGFHACNGMCVSNTSTASCGSSCTACAAPAGGTATCDGTACGASCGAGKKPCANACIPEGQACMGNCPNGSHNCNGLCLSDTSVNSCGASCTPCPAVEGASPTCAMGVCGSQCDLGFKRCGAGCIPSSLCCDDGECAGGKCSSGKCCPASQTNCAGACVDLTSDANNCGACGTPCAGRCSRGVCCGANQTSCGGVCKNTNTDASFCGPSCTKCTLGLLCLNGTCAL